ncbi:MAG: septal ring lytic transglycosylase RlpA family protein [Cyanobacteria bacterium P01_A01_bin.37]
MTVLKVFCVTSCIGGLVPLVASTEPLQPIEQTMSALLSFTASSDSEALPGQVVTAKSYVTPNLSMTHAYGVHQLSVYALNVLSDVIAPSSQTSVIPTLAAQDYDELASSALNAATFNLDVPNPSAFSDFGLSNQEDEISNTQSVTLRNHSLSSPTPDDTTMVEPAPSINVVLAPATQSGASVLNTPFKLNALNASSQRLADVTQCSVLKPMSIDDSELDITDVSHQLDIADDTSYEIAQVHIDDQVVAEFAHQGEAYRFAETIKSLIKSEDFQPADLETRPENGTFVISSQDKVVTTIDSATALVGYDTALVAIAWTNNLRVALGAEPLSMGDSQAHVQSLEANGQRVGGVASWYGPYFHGRLTASGEFFDQNELTAAHPTLPFDTYLNVTNLKNGQTVVVRINDRGPYIGRRSLDLSWRAAKCLGSEETGVVPYTATLLEEKPLFQQAVSQADLN